MKTSMRFLSTLDSWVVISLRTICIICFSVLLLLLLGNVFVRYVPVAAFYWFDEVVECAFAWMVFCGAAALWARDDHFRLEWFPEKIQGWRYGRFIIAALELLSLFFLLIFATQSLRLTILANDWTPVFNVSKRFLYACMPVSGFIMVAYSIRNIIRAMRQISTKSNIQEESGQC